MKQMTEAKEMLNPKIWQGEELLSEVKEKLSQISNNFVDYLKRDNVTINVKDMIVVGSNANYNYTDESDIDLHLIVDFSHIENEEEKRLLTILYNAYKSIFNKKYDINIKGHQVEIYVEPENTELKSEGIFSVLNGWIKKPSKETFKADDVIDSEFETEFKKWEDRFNKILSDVNVELKEETKSTQIITTYNGSNSPHQDFKNMDLMNSTEIGVHCGTKDAVKSLGYRHIYEIKLSNFKLLEFKFDMTSEWAVPELAYKLSDDEKIVKSLLVKLKMVSHRKDKREQYSKIFRDFILSKGYNLISYINEIEHKDSISYIIIDTSTIISAKLVKEETLSSVETDKLVEIETFLNDLNELRKTSLKKDGENAVGNRIFKQFRRLGYIQSMRDAKTSLEQKDMSLESLYEEVSDIKDEDLFWNLRDGIVDKQGKFVKETKYSVSAKEVLDTLEGNLYLNNGKIDILPNPDGMFAVSPEQYPLNLLDKANLLKFKEAVEGELVMFYNSPDWYGSEYSVLTDNEELVIKACKGELGTNYAKQRAYAKYVKGEYLEVVVNQDVKPLSESKELLKKIGVSGYNKPKRTSDHPTKSHVVVAKEGDEVKTIRFGQQGVKGAGKNPKTKKEKARKKSFKARHAKDIAKGKMSAAYWANKVKW